MFMKRKMFVVSLVLMMVFAILTACGGSGSGTSSQPTNVPAPSSPAPSDSGQPDEGQKDEGQTAKENQYPLFNDPITVIVPLAAGGTGDVINRTIADIAAKYFNQKIIVENRPGGSGAVGIAALLAKPADGKTIFYNSQSMVVSFGTGALPYKEDDILPLATVASDRHALYVPANSPFNTLEDLIKYAKENPGKLNIGGVNTQTSAHAFFLKLMKVLGIEATYVPYDGSGTLANAVLGGILDAAVGTIASVSSYDQGQVRLLGLTFHERMEKYPDVPTFEELGYGMGKDLQWRGFFLHPATPPEIVEKLSIFFKDIVSKPEWNEYLERTSQELFMNDPQSFADFYKNEIAEIREMFGDN